MIGWFLNIVYLILLTALAPLLAYRSLTQSKYRSGWREKLRGHVPRRDSERRCVWFHAVSVGEVLLLEGLIEDVWRRNPDLDVWISTTTNTGHAVATEKCPSCRVVYFPLDFTWAVRAAVERVRPDLVVLVELEIWPNFIRAVTGAGIPLALINGRMGEKSFRGYHYIRGFMRPVLQRFTSLSVQTDEHRHRLIQLGASDRRIQVTGTIKFDGVMTDRANRGTTDLREAFGFSHDETILVAGSTHAPEEEMLLQSYRQLKLDFPTLRLVIAPRHRERFDEVASLVHATGFSLLRRSESEMTGKRSADVVLLDTLGELSGCWGLADIAFVGGSLTNRGGQNMIDPCACGAAVLFGPNTWNFRHVVEMLLQADAATVVDAERLTSEIRRCLSNPAEARQRGERARELVRSQQGATERTVSHLETLLDFEDTYLTRRAA